MKKSQIIGSLVSLLAFASTVQFSAAQELPALTAKELAFSVENMDTSVDPRVDFYRYASGKWQDTYVRPERVPRAMAFQFAADQLNQQMAVAMSRAASEAATAPKGSPTQLVGDYYAARMDTDRINALGMAPLQPELDRVAAISSLKELSTYIGRFQSITGTLLFVGFGAGTDRVDNSKVVLYAAPGSLGMPFIDIYQAADGDPRREGYRFFIRDSLKLAGYSQERAEKVSHTVIAIETAMFKGKLTPVEASDPRNKYFPTEFAAFQASVPELDLSAVMSAIGIKNPEKIVMTEPHFLPVLSQVLRVTSLADIKDYVSWSLVRTSMSALPTSFDGPISELNLALMGTKQLPPRGENVLSSMQAVMGHPVSQVYVQYYFKEETRAKAIEMIQRIKQAFVTRLQKNTWLTPETHAAALQKLDKLSFAVGYPNNWIDYSSVDIRRDDALGNLMRLNEFANKRTMDTLGKPPKPDGFSIVGATLPVVINAAYNSTLNGFEVPAAILQPPMFEAELDAPVYYCKLGQIIGHEMTHGFDSAGRQFNADGNLRDWWTKADSAAFEKEAKKLIAQANAYEILPGLTINGMLTVTENMADVGGMNSKATWPKTRSKM
jgi:putative endopeptidase